MNGNVEIINENLWAIEFDPKVKIEGIDFENQPPSYKEGGRISKNGVLVLNKYYSGYEFLKRAMSALMNDSDEELKLKKDLASKPGK